MYKYFIPVFLLTNMIAKAQVTISGKTINSKNKVLSGVSISIKNSYDGATSDSTGNYFLRQMKRENKC